MFSSNSPKYSSSRRASSYRSTRKPQGMQRSGSLFSAITKIVSRPLSWFASSDNADDLGKRQRLDTVESSDDEQVGSVRKRMRVESPPPDVQLHDRYAAGYLDPPQASVRRSQSNVLPRQTASAKFVGSSQRASIVRAPSLLGTRTMSMDPPAVYATYNRDSVSIPPPRDSPMDMSRNTMSVGPRDSSMQPPSSPFRIRTSLTPQPSPAKPIRREASAPPPLSSLMSRPIFVKPPVEEQLSGRELRAQKTLSLGSIAELNRPSRSPSRDLILNGMPTLHSAPTQLNISSNASLNAAGRAFRDLEMYKSPIVPSRYKDAKVIPEFLRPKKAHVPIPMSMKGRTARPSLGMSEPKVETMREREKVVGRGDGKPYAGKGNLSKLLAKRKAEEEEALQLDVINEEGVNEFEPGKRDVGVSAKFASDSDDDKRRRRVSRSLAADDPFSKPASSYDRSQPYGRVGRTRASRLAPGTRSVPLANKKLGNRFSADFDDEDSIDDVVMEGQGGGEKEIAAPTHPPPKGFSFASKETVQHDYTASKEPPVPSLPFSLGKVASAEAPADSKPVTIMKSAVDTGGTAASSAAPPAFKPPTFDAFAPLTNVLPKVAVVPPTPEQSSASSNPLSVPPVNATESISATTSGVIPNFFANSAYLTGEKKTEPDTSAHTSKSSSAIPTTDSQNPFWDGDKVDQTAATSSFDPVKASATSSKPSPFGGFSKPSSQPFAKPVEGPMAPTPSLFSPAPPKQAEALPVPSDQRSASIPLHNPSVAPATSSFVPSPSPSSNGFFASTQPIAGSSPFGSLLPTPNEPLKSSENRSTAPSPSPSLFAFGNPSNPQIAASGSTATEATRPVSAPSLSGAQTEQNAVSFSFAAPPSTAPTTGSAGPSNDVSAAKPLFGSGNGFSFGQPSTAATNTADSAKSLFAFGAPPVTPPSGSDTKNSFAGFGASTTAAPGFPFSTAAKPAETLTTTPFTFGATARPTTPPNTGDEMSMEESPTRVDSNGKLESITAKPSLTPLTFGSSTTSTVPQSGGGTSGFTFGVSANNVFAPKTAEDSSKGSGFSFGASNSAPPISSSFSFGQKSDTAATPTTAFGAPTPNPFTTTPTTGTSPFNFGAAPTNNANPFSAPVVQQTPSFSFGSPATAPNNPFNFGASQPPSPATSVSGLPQLPAAANMPFTFGQTNGATSSPPVSFGGSSAGGGTLFNIGATPRPTKKLPNRGRNLKR